MAKILINKEKNIYVDHTEILSFSHETRNNFQRCWVEVHLRKDQMILSDQAWFDLIEEYERIKTQCQNENYTASSKKRLPK